MVLFCGVSALSFALWQGVVLVLNYYTHAGCGVLGDVGVHFCGVRVKVLPAANTL